jgi:hypothetical protein
MYPAASIVQQSWRGDTAARLLRHYAYLSLGSVWTVVRVPCVCLWKGELQRPSISVHTGSLHVVQAVACRTHVYGLFMANNVACDALAAVRYGDGEARSLSYYTQALVTAWLGRRGGQVPSGGHVYRTSHDPVRQLSGQNA